MNDATKGKFAGILGEVQTDAINVLHEEMKLSVEDAQRAAGLVLETIRGRLSGSAAYFAKGHFFAITEKHRRIYRRFTGANHAPLAREFDLTERQIYNIIAAVEAEEFERRQQKLPGM